MIDLSRQVFIAFDTETTGLSPQNSNVIEIAGVRFTGTGQEIARFSTLANPGVRIDPEVTKIIENERAVKGIKRVSMSEDEIMSRILNVMQVEGQMVLEEGIAATSEAIDVVMVNGYGFPRWRGGLMFIATQSQER